MRPSLNELTPEVTPRVRAKALYAFTVFCTLYKLRYLGSLITPNDQMYMRPWSGMLLFDKDESHRMRAALYDVETGLERMWLAHPRVIKIGHGGVLIGGAEMYFRGTKSKGESFQQSWWCVPATMVNLSHEEPAEANTVTAPPD